MDESQISRVIDEVVRTIAGQPLTNRTPSRIVQVGLSNRHGHLTKEHAEILFGAGRRLTPLRALLQPDQFATKETVSIATSKGVFHNVRLIGPERKYTQFEVSRSDAFALGLDPPIRQSGELDDTPGCVVIGPKGSVTISRGVIIAGRHLHCHTSEAQALGLRDRQTIRVKVPGPRGGIMDNVLVRVGDIHRLELHVDTDEGNAFGLRSGEKVELVIRRSE
jgi:putative phosphotransacetylase